MIHVLHSLGWAIVAWLLSLFPISYMLVKAKVEKTSGPIMLWSTLIAFSVFLLTL